MYWNQVAGSSKQATLGDSRVTLQNTVDDTEEHPMSFAAVKQRTSQKLAFIDSTTF